jgi:hypothetical protein
MSIRTSLAWSAGSRYANRRSTSRATWRTFVIGDWSGSGISCNSGGSRLLRPDVLAGLAVLARESFTLRSPAVIGCGMRISNRLEAGLVRCNAPTSGVGFHAPFGGTKDSSYGPREQGLAARELHTETRSVLLAP